VRVVDVVAVRAQVQELAHADGALVAHHLGHVVPELRPQVRAVDSVVDRALKQFEWFILHL
jgi:hypothetical protein